MNILGISGLYHDSAAAVITDGVIVAAMQEERLTRKKHDRRFPINAVNYCLSLVDSVDCIVYYDNPLITLDRYLDNLFFAKDSVDDLFSAGFDEMFSSKLAIEDKIHSINGLENKPIYYVPHHISHAASGFYPSPYKDAIVIVVDGVGEWATTSIIEAHDKNLEIKEEIRYPNSLGLLYSAFTYFCGFKVNEGDYKFMGLAPYGDPVYYDLIKNNVIKFEEDGSYSLNLEYFSFYRGTVMTSGLMEDLLGGAPRLPESEITKREMDIAASVQKIIEEVLINIVKYSKYKYGKNISNLVLAGGVALNCVANGKIVRSKIYENCWIQPAAGDAGGALGAALYGYYVIADNIRNVVFPDAQQGSYLGNSYSQSEVEEFLISHGIKYEKFEDDKEEQKAIAKLLSQNNVVGLFHGRMEFGPRALGNRSIIANPMDCDMQKKLNLKVKKRESFRPFAPAVIEEDAGAYFDINVASPYMLLTAYVKKELCLPFMLHDLLESEKYNMLSVVSQPRSSLPAITHVDFSARIQTVSQKTNPFFYGVLSEFKKATGCSVLINTSFNVRGEPIVCYLEDALRCFCYTDIDVLVVENCLVKKSDLPHDFNIGKIEFELD